MCCTIHHIPPSETLVAFRQQSGFVDTKDQFTIQNIVSGKDYNFLQWPSDDIRKHANLSEGETRQGCWIPPRLCAEGMDPPVDGSLHRHFQYLIGADVCPNLLQVSHYPPSAKDVYTFTPEWLPSFCTHPSSCELLQAPKSRSEHQQHWLLTSTYPGKTRLPQMPCLLRSIMSHPIWATKTLTSECCSTTSTQHSTPTHTGLQVPLDKKWKVSAWKVKPAGAALFSSAGSCLEQHAYIFRWKVGGSRYGILCWVVGMVGVQKWSSVVGRLLFMSFMTSCIKHFIMIGHPGLSTRLTKISLHLIMYTYLRWETHRETIANFPKNCTWKCKGFNVCHFFSADFVGFFLPWLATNFQSSAAVRKWK